MGKHLLKIVRGDKFRNDVKKARLPQKKSDLPYKDRDLGDGWMAYQHKPGAYRDFVPDFKKLVVDFINFHSIDEGMKVNVQKLEN